MPECDNRGASDANAESGGVLYRHDTDAMMPLVVRRGEYTSGVQLQSIKDDGEPCQTVPVFRDELLPVARVLIEAYEEGA